MPMVSDMRSLALKVIACVCIYLLASISTASAIEISIYRQIMSGGNPVPSGQPLVIEDLNTGDVIEKTFEFIIDPADNRYENVEVKISVTGKDPSYNVKRIFLFKCKDNNPLDCVDYSPVEAVDTLSGQKGTFYWKDVSRNTEANFLTLVKIKHKDYNTESWIGYWDHAKRNSIQDFDHETYEISDLSVYADVGKSPEWIKEFILRHYMIPMNWVDHVDLGSVNGKEVDLMYELVSDKETMETSTFSKFKPDGNTIKSSPKDYLMVFGEGSLSNPFTFFSNTAPPCGDGQCDIGENPEICCLDCGCSQQDEECTLDVNYYPNGVCHECGDGTIDPTENGSTCCVDAGCSDIASDAYCDTSENEDGFCVTPVCPDGVCEPTEDSATCAPDCFDTEGKTCKDVFGEDYYYQNQECVRAVCGNGECELAGGEGGENCCADCQGTSPCPGGKYCDDSVPRGVCTLPNCGDGRCEEEGGETYENCCADCDDCPSGMTCGTSGAVPGGMCYSCGNGVFEDPIESSSNCCSDAGCDVGQYCTISNNCVPHSQMSFTVSMLPTQIDCTQADSTAEVRFTPVNGPMELESYDRVSYIYEGSMYSLTGCSVQGDMYVCPFPLAGSDTFRGCYGGTGLKDVSFVLSVKYYEDAEGRQNGKLKYKELNMPFSVNIMKARAWSCTPDGTCSESDGETSASCCYDCGCDGSSVCTATGCRSEGDITLTKISVPRRSEIDCKNAPDEDMGFTLSLRNIPDSSDDPFDIVSVSLEYDHPDEGMTVYNSNDIPGFSCTPVTNDEGNFVGIIDCTMPVAYFPACSDATEQADMWLNLGIVGGGLSTTYVPYIGKIVRSDNLNFAYIYGLPMCGDGKPDPELGETEDNCCADMGCASEDEICTSEGSCQPSDVIGLEMTIDPVIDCNTDSEDAKVTIELDMKNGIFPFTGGSGVMLGSFYLNGKRIEEMGGHCAPRGGYGSGAWDCEVPISEFIPYCFEAGSHTESGSYPPIEASTEITWQDAGGSTVTLPVAESLSFTIDAREWECNGNGNCEERLGETKDNCCWDCGCPPSNDGTQQVCTRDSNLICVNPYYDVLIEVTPSPEAGLNCRSPSEDDDLRLDIEFTNHPYEIDFLRWVIEYKDGVTWTTLTEQNYNCAEELDYYGDRTGNYVCKVPLYYFPPCAKRPNENDGDTPVRELKVTAKMFYTTMTGKKVIMEPFDNADVTILEFGTPLCGNGQCNAGETKYNCCNDCGCDSDDGSICTESGTCVDCGEAMCDVKLDIDTANIPSVTCQMAPGTIENYRMLDYRCNFQEPLTLEAAVDPLPVNSIVRSGSYTWTWTDAEGMIQESTYTNLNPSQTADGWELGFHLNTDGSFIIKDDGVKNTYLSDITLTIESTTTTGDSKVFKVKAATADDDRQKVNEYGIPLKVKAVKGDDLLAYEKVLKDMIEAMDKANRIACNAVGILATCVICSLMASGENPQQTKEEFEKGNNELKGEATKYNDKVNALDSIEKDGKVADVSPELKDEIYNDFKSESDVCGDLDFNHCLIENKDLNSQVFGNLREKYLNDHMTNKQGIMEKYHFPSQTIGNTPAPAQQGNMFGNTKMGMFTELMNLVDNGKMVSGFTVRNLMSPGFIAGVGAGAIFLVAGSSIGTTNTEKGKDCLDTLLVYVLSAIGVCGALVSFGSPATLRPIVKMCDFLETALGMLKMVLNIRTTALDYQMCMVSAEAEMSRGQATEEDPYMMAQRTTNYYQKLASCQERLLGNTDKIVDDMQKVTESATNQGYGNNNPGYTGFKPNILPEPSGQTVGACEDATAKDLQLPYYYPPQGTGYVDASGNVHGNYGTLSIIATYNVDIFDEAGKTLRSTSITPSTTFSTTLSVNRGMITCTADKDGLQCRDQSSASTRVTMLNPTVPLNNGEKGFRIVNGEITVTLSGRSYKFDYLGPCDADSHCSNGVKDADEGEEYVDCGGNDCVTCDALCSDGQKNGDEEFTDCGGTNPKCDECKAHCNNGVKDTGLGDGRDETGIDCGGECPLKDCCKNEKQDENEDGVDCGTVCNNECCDKEANCKGKDCGDDKCGGSCPPGCGSDEKCINGKCLVCDCSCAQNTCVGEKCDDGCGGKCDGTLEPDCYTYECGDSANGCGKCGELNGECPTGKKCVNKACIQDTCVTSDECTFDTQICSGGHCVSKCPDEKASADGGHTVIEFAMDPMNDAEDNVQLRFIYADKDNRPRSDVNKVYLREVNIMNGYEKITEYWKTVIKKETPIPLTYDDPWSGTRAYYIFRWACPCQEYDMDRGDHPKVNTVFKATMEFKDGTKCNYDFTLNVDNTGTWSGCGFCNMFGTPSGYYTLADKN